MSAKVFPQYRAAASAALGSFALGTLMGWSSPSQTCLRNGDAGFSVDEESFAWISSLLPLGAACGCIPMGFIMKSIGVRLTMLLLIAPFCIGWTTLIYARNVETICAARFILGTAGGPFCICCPVYTAEIAQKQIRGMLGIFFQLFICLGILASFVIGALFNYKTQNYILAAIPLLFGLIFYPNPESPIYLMKTGREDKALLAMQQLRGKDYDSAAELNEMKTNLFSGPGDTSTLWASFRHKNVFKALAYSLSLVVLLQLCGINAVVFYSDHIFNMSNTRLSTSFSSIVVGAIMAAFTLISGILVDRFGRRFLLFISSVIMSVSIMILGSYFQGFCKSLSWLPLVCLCTFITGFSIGVGPITWVFASEVFPNELRELAMSMCATTNWTLAFLVTLFFIILQQSLGPAIVFWMLSAISAVGAIGIIIFLPETKGKSLAEIQQKLSN